LRIEYKFINQSKQRIEQSLTNQKISAPKSWCRTINSEATLKLTSLHIHLISKADVTSGSFIFESRRHVNLFSKAGLC
jgi:hypothetical protein